jgi:hypothetical protein
MAYGAEVRVTDRLGPPVLVRILFVVLRARKGSIGTEKDRKDLTGIETTEISRHVVDLIGWDDDV